jgi:serine/threonine-protein kinase HipA
MIARTLDVRLESFQDPVGTLTSTSNGDINFAYAEQFLARSNKVPLSLALPLRPEKFSDVQTRAFFDNLLPENDQLDQVIEREALSRSDVVGLLFHLGADCPGAISCIPGGADAAKVPGVLSTDYDMLPDEEISEIVRRLANREPLPNEMRDPSPLAGVQRKIALTQFQNGDLGVPKVGLRVPTTHILKVPRRTKRREAKLEVAAAALASAIGFNVAVPKHIVFGDLFAILVRRFDRTIEGGGSVRRVHQEDFAQALGLPSTMKYERYANGARRFGASTIANLLELTSDPAISKRIFLEATIFNLIVGNSDNHAKNHALLYEGGPAPHFAPLYDILPVRLDKSVTHDFSFKIGHATSFSSLTKDDVFAFLHIFGLSTPAANRFISETVAPMLAMIDELTKHFTAQGLKDFDDLIGREATQLAEMFALNVRIRERDYFPQTGA